jgi:hypothetical protein
MKKALVGMCGVIAGCGGLAVAADPDVASREAWRVQVNTNATTVTTRYTASHAGSMLVGKVGGTNAVWVAVAAGTNSWVKIAQRP